MRNPLGEFFKFATLGEQLFSNKNKNSKKQKVGY